MKTDKTNIFEFIHTSLCQKQKLNVSKISTNIITKNTGVLKIHTRDIKN